MRQTETPFLFLSQLIDGHPKPWNHFKIDGLMVNAYEILQKTNAQKKAMDNGIHRYLGFDGFVGMDSGGFIFMRKKVLDVDPQRILDLYESSKPNLSVVLDHPLEPNLPRVKEERDKPSL